MSWGLVFAFAIAMTVVAFCAVWCAFYEQSRGWVRLGFSAAVALFALYMFFPGALEPGPRAILWAAFIALLSWRLLAALPLALVIHLALSLTPAIALLYFVFEDAQSLPWQQPGNLAAGAIALWAAVIRRLPRLPGRRGTNHVDHRQEERPPTELTSDDGNRLVDAIDLRFGSTRFASEPLPPAFVEEFGIEHARKGERANNAHGVFARGVLRVEPSFQSLVPPSLFQHDEIEVLARFSNVKSYHDAPATQSNAGAGCPLASNRAGTYRDDTKRDVRGLAIRFNPHGHQSMDLVTIDADRFVARNREDFLLFMRALSGSRCRTLTVSLFMAAVGRTTLTALYRAAGKKINSYCDRSYHGIHGFWWKFDHGQELVRYRLVPEPTERDVTVLPAAFTGPRKLVDELAYRVSDRGATPKFRLEMIKGTQLDRRQQLDPVRPWPKKQIVLTVGVLEITKVLDERVSPDDVRLLDDLGFSPHNLCAGVRPSDDEVLMARRAAYPTSHLRRLAPRSQPRVPAHSEVIEKPAHERTARRMFVLRPSVRLLSVVIFGVRQRRSDDRDAQHR